MNRSTTWKLAGFVRKPFVGESMSIAEVRAASMAASE